MATETTQNSFDELARGLASGTLSRGRALRLLGGVLVGSALASVPGVALADDDCRSFGRRCRRDSQCCSRNCVRRGDEKVCGCPEGKRRCDDRCVNLKTDERHCGSCSNSCEAGQECVRGVCQGGCPSGTTTCGTECCAEGQECVGGVCQCPSGTTLCGGNCVSNQCDTGQTFDPTTCQCLSACPEQPCCCTCTYMDATGAPVSTCVSPYAGDVLTCRTLCNAQTPPGTTFVDQDFVCSLEADTAIVCAPASTGTGTTCGANAPCTPPPA
jgi:hypothetical protein